MVSTKPKKIWIDLDNSPHVVFFRPIIEEFEKRGYSILLTARDRFQVCELADLLKLKYIKVGRRYGENKFVKVFCLLFRAIQLAPIAYRAKPDIAVSHGSRSQLMVAAVFKIPSVLIFDYEHAKNIVTPDFFIAPELIPDDAISFLKKPVLRYPGIKEDVYVPDFKPNPNIRYELGIKPDNLMVTIRPPAMEAHYRSPKSEELFKAVIEFLGQEESIRMVLLPRNDRQEVWIKKLWPKWCEDGRIVIPRCAVDGLNLIWYSDFVVSGGGTMNREAAAMGVPVYSIFGGQIGSVDQYLSEAGRLTFVRETNDLKSKIDLRRREHSENYKRTKPPALEKIVEEIVSIIEKR